MKTRCFLKAWPILCWWLLASPVHAGSATWVANPGTNDWNTPANWSPTTVPSRPGDTATFATSSVTDLSISAGVKVDGMVFEPGASAFAIANQPGVALTISGEGVANNSGVVQNITIQGDAKAGGTLYFTNAATAGDLVTYTNERSSSDGLGALIEFKDSSTAGSGQFLNFAGVYSGAGGVIEFRESSTAGRGNFVNTGTSDGQSFPHINFRDDASAGEAVFTTENFSGGMVAFFNRATADYGTFLSQGPFSSVLFNDTSTAGHATITNEGGTYYLGGAITYLGGKSSAEDGVLIANGSRYVGIFGYGNVALFEQAQAARGTFIANAGQLPGANGGVIYLYNSASADQATFTANGGTGGALGGRIIFYIDSTANEATLVANGSDGNGGGNEGGGIEFRDSSSGDTAKVQLHGDGYLDLHLHDASGVTIGSLEGDGLVILGNSNLSVGSNGMSTLFSGVIQDGAGITESSLTKVGPGTLALTGANTYSGPTVIQGGTLVIINQTASATASGPVIIEAGTLAGRGPIAGAVTVGTGAGAGAVLAPSRIGGKPALLTVQSSLTFKSDATCLIRLNSKVGIAAQIVAEGVTINGANFSLVARGVENLPPHTVLTVISNTGPSPIDGFFTNLPDGGTISAGGNTFQVSYAGGDGNDLVLTVL